MMNNDDINKKKIELAYDIYNMTDSVIGIIGKIASYSVEERKIIEGMYEELAGHKFEITRDASDIRKKMIEYLKNENINIPDDPTYEVEQFNPMSREEFFKNWNNFDSENGRRR